MNLQPYIPFTNYKKYWINEKLEKLKNHYNNKKIKDCWNCEMSWEIVEYYLGLAYNYYYFGINPGIGLRINPMDLI